MSNGGIHAENTEELILSAARVVFLRKGLEGARMQEIADEAGINKALLHYYFRSKEKLFLKIFDQVLNELLPQLGQNLQSDASFEDKVKVFVDIYFTLFLKNPFIPQFVIGELNRDPEGLKVFVNKLTEKVIKPNFSKLDQQLQAEISKGTIIPVDTRNFLVNLISMIIFPFVAQPILSQLLFGGNTEEFKSFLLERKKELPRYIMNSVKR